jgi:hypothetical protein
MSNATIHVLALTVPCCDNCVLKKVLDSVDLTPMEMDLLRIIKRINERVVYPKSPNPTSEVVLTNDDEQLDDIVEESILPTGKRVRQPGCRRQERLEAARNALSNWCQSVWKAEYSHCIWGPEVLLPDTVLTKLASRARIKTVSDIKNEVPEWLWADEHGDAILKLLEPIDLAWHEEGERKKVEKKAKRAKISAERKVKWEEDRLAKAQKATAQRKAALSAQACHPNIQQHQSVFACVPQALAASTPQAGSSTGMFYSYYLAPGPINST